MQTQDPADPAPRKRILVVDDEAAVTDLLVTLLEGQGFEAHAVNNPLRALKRANEVRPDLIILDFFMSQLLGPEVSQQLKGNPATREVPVIFLSGLADEDHRLIAAMSGAVAYLEKPVDHQKLLEVIRAQFKDRS
ncbi:MAG TPA: response regulator [Planctomycetota bacterium]|nr:response regulator [Planctomycetota bacterium]